MHHQVSEYIDKDLSSFSCGYGKEFSTQTALLSLLEKWKSTLHKNGFAGAVLMDLSVLMDLLSTQLITSY